jgi:hypothetical protein
MAGQRVTRRALPGLVSADSQHSKLRRWLRGSLILLLVIVASVAGLWGLAKYKDQRARARWKEVALQRLAGLSFTNEEIRSELAELTESRIPNTDPGWVHDRVLRMTNGESVVYLFWHGANNGFVDHLFLGHSSDGRWLYSTYHFCSSMAAVRADDPPGSIAEFAQRYSAHEFDGKSDVCLQHTWPPRK